MSIYPATVSEDDPLCCRIREIGNHAAGACVIVTCGRLVSGNTPTPYFCKEDEMIGTLAFDSQNCRFYLVESGVGIARVHDIEYDKGRLFISGWPTEGKWRWIRWSIEF